MKSAFLLFLSTTLSITTLFGQAAQPVAPPSYNANDPLTMISSDVAKTARSVDSLARSWGEFTRTFSSNQGLLLDEEGRKLILALEVLNRMEVSMANMQKLRLDLNERQSAIRLKITTIVDDLQPQSVERYAALRGTTDAEAVRTSRRQSLEKEYRELSQLLQQVGRELSATELEIRRTDVQLRALRNQIFGEVERQFPGN
jgi:hypothetical protein